MAKINKVYGAFFNGVSEQNPELALDNQCKEMINCIPDVVRGIKKRPPATYVSHKDIHAEAKYLTSNIFHTYDRGENGEEYIFMSTQDPSDPIEVYNTDGDKMVVSYEVANESACKTYLSNSNLKGLTVQDRTWLFNRDVTVALDKSATAPIDDGYDKKAFYWIKRGSGDRWNPFNYAVYLDGTTYAVDPDKPEQGGSAVLDPPTGAEDSDVAASLLAAKVNASANFTADVKGSILMIYRSDGADFEFSSWDSWGNEASQGWKGAVNRITDLPKEMPHNNVFVEIIGSENNSFTNYFVKWNGTAWQETLDPKADRGKLTNMPIKCDRISYNSVSGLAEFRIDLIDWSLPRVGNEDNNPDPSFVGRSCQDLFFYKNRLGIASEDSVTLTEAANYTNFYMSTAIDLVDTDVVDITVSTNQASNIYYAKPFNNSLYLFTKDAQYELVHDGIFSPKNVSIENVTNYPMKTDVEPVVVNDSLYFISLSNNRQQLREYIKGDNLSVRGIDLNTATPTYMASPITKLIADGVIGSVICGTQDGMAYVYNSKNDGEKRIQSAWSKWEFFTGLNNALYEWWNLGTSIAIITKTPDVYTMHKLFLDDNGTDNRYDTTYDYQESGIKVYEYWSSILLPDYYPQVTGVRTPLNKALIKRIIIEGEGQFTSDIYRKDYATTYTKQHDLSLRDGDMSVNSRVGNVDITIYDNSYNDFTISSVVVESLYTPTSKELK